MEPLDHGKHLKIPSVEDDVSCHIMSAAVSPITYVLSNAKLVRRHHDVNVGARSRILLGIEKKRIW